MLFKSLFKSSFMIKFRNIVDKKGKLSKSEKEKYMDDL